VVASRHAYGRGEVLWIPTLLGLGARLAGTQALAALLDHELRASLSPVPFRFTRHQPGILSRNLDCDGPYLTVLINKNSQPVEVALSLPETLSLDRPPEILFSECGGKILAANRFLLPPEETLVLKWV